MRHRTFSFAISATVLLGASLAAAQTYDTERRRDTYTDETPARDYQTTPTRDYQTQTTTTTRETVIRPSAPSRALMTTDVAAVERQRDRVLHRDMAGKKLGAADYQELRRQRHDVDQLIDRMKAGHPVSTESIDRALGLYDQSRPGY